LLKFNILIFFVLNYYRFQVKAKPTKETLLICCQIRIGGQKINEHRNDMFLQPKWYSFQYWEFIKKKLTKTTDDYRIFVATDNQQVRNESILEFGSKLIDFDDIVESFDNVDFIKNDNKKECNKADKTFLDFEAFQLCDSVVITEYSQFGKFAILNRKEPTKNLFMHKHNQKEFEEINKLENKNSKIENERHSSNEIDSYFVKIDNLSQFEYI
jgi:hypothetical protein